MARSRGWSIYLFSLLVQKKAGYCVWVTISKINSVIVATDPNIAAYGSKSAELPAPVMQLISW